MARQPPALLHPSLRELDSQVRGTNKKFGKKPDSNFNYPFMDLLSSMGLRGFEYGLNKINKRTSGLSNERQNISRFNPMSSQSRSMSGFGSMRGFGSSLTNQLFNRSSRYSLTGIQNRLNQRSNTQNTPNDSTFSGQPLTNVSFSVQGNAGNARGMQGVLNYRSMAERASKETGVPTALILSVMGLESGGNPNAVSPAGATGLMQIMPNYWSDTAQKVTGSSNLRDPWTNIRTGAEVLKQMEQTWGGWENAVKAYLAGTPNSTAVDAHGTGVGTYAQIIADNLAWLQQQGVGQPTTEGSFGAAPTAKLGNAIENARQFVGQPYVWGGESPREGFDCSGLMQWAYGQAGIQLPRTAGEQYDNTTRIDASQAQAGDLIFFHSTYNEPNHWITHVGIYLGNGKMLHSGSGGIGVVDLNTQYYQSRLAGYGRVRG